MSFSPTSLSRIGVPAGSSTLRSYKIPMQFSLCNRNNIILCNKDSAPKTMAKHIPFHSHFIRNHQACSRIYRSTGHESCFLRLVWWNSMCILMPVSDRWPYSMSKQGGGISGHVICLHPTSSGKPSLFFRALGLRVTSFSEQLYHLFFLLFVLQCHHLLLINFVIYSIGIPLPSLA